MKTCEGKGEGEGEGEGEGVDGGQVEQVEDLHADDAGTVGRAPRGVEQELLVRGGAEREDERLEARGSAPRC